MRKPKFVPGEIYHIYNRGVEKRKIFMDDNDYSRFVHDLFEFNDQNPVSNLHRRVNSVVSQLFEVEPRTVEKKPRMLLVEVLAWCLMPNHYHLLLKERVAGGIINFMKKINTGFTMFFNKKYDRVGPLLQGRFKAVGVDQDSHLKYLVNYIHLNPIDLVAPEWRLKKMKNYSQAKKFLETYRWSSYLDYANKFNFPSLLQKNSLLKLFEKSHDFGQEVLDYLKEMDLEMLRDIALEEI